MPMSPEQFETFHRSKYNLDTICQRIDEQLRGQNATNFDQATVYVTGLLPPFIIQDITNIYTRAGWHRVQAQHKANGGRDDATELLLSRAP